jgi:hypothetical protein
MTTFIQQSKLDLLTKIGVRRVRYVLGRILSNHAPTVYRLAQYMRPRPSAVQRTGEEIFRDIYWRRLAIGAETVSGPGSTFAATRVIRDALPLIVREYQIRTILDIPCGDFNWMSQVGLDDVTYLGGDILKELVNRLNHHFSSPRRHFRRLSVIDDPLPASDLVICRDCLVHLTTPDILKALSNIKRSGSRYLLTTTFPSVSCNVDTTTGVWRPINLELHPFQMGTPIRIVNERCTEADGAYADKSLGLWDVAQLVAAQ